MYFDKVQVLSAKDIFEEERPILAHLHETRKETLQEHMTRCLYYFRQIVEAKALEPLFIQFEAQFLQGRSERCINLYRALLIHIIVGHDYGKVGRNFQAKKMENKEFTWLRAYSVTNHSILSSLIYINHWLPIIRSELDIEEQQRLILFLMYHAYVISKHHGHLDSFEDFSRKVLEVDSEGYQMVIDYPEVFNDSYRAPMVFGEDMNLLRKCFEIAKHEQLRCVEDEGITYGLYIYEKLLSSLLLTCDYYATYEFMQQKEVKVLDRKKDIDLMYQAFNHTSLVKGIRAYEEKGLEQVQDWYGVENINLLRNQLFLEAERTLAKNREASIYYLEAPTGSGKSMVAMNLSFQLIEQNQSLNKIVYVYPFNTLVEQNLETMNKLFGEEVCHQYVSVINSIYPMKVDKEENSDAILYEEALLRRQFLQDPMVLTTHVSFFKYLFGTDKEQCFSLASLANSVVVLDEVQSYRNSLWKKMINFLTHYANFLNIKVILMSATLPNLHQLYGGMEKIVPLIEERDRYFKHPLFKERVHLNYELMALEGSKEDKLEHILVHVIDKAKHTTNNNLLIEFITKERAYTFYQRLLEVREGEGHGISNRQIELITGDDNLLERKRVIKRIKQEKDLILVATQVIEAGVDIDVEIGYKDCGLLDFDEQYLGRINRSCLGEGISYFFNLDTAKEIYRGDKRNYSSLSLEEEAMKEILKEKEFKGYYQRVLEATEKEEKSYTRHNYKAFVEVVNSLDFREIDKQLAVIVEEMTCTVFLNRSLTLEDGTVLEGEQVWRAYLKLLKDTTMPYAKRRVMLSETMALMDYFTYNLRVGWMDAPYNERVGDLFYIHDGENYFRENKLDRKAFINSSLVI